MKEKRMTSLERGHEIAKDAELRARIFDRLCKHVAAGYSLDCFEELSILSIRKYLELYPEEFVGEELECAMRKGKQYWEGLGRRQADGTCLGNSRTWYYNMSNRYGWNEKQQIETDNKHQVSVNVISYANQKASQVDES
jgi:hypothetical protein